MRDVKGLYHGNGEFKETQSSFRFLQRGREVVVLSRGKEITHPNDRDTITIPYKQRRVYGLPRHSRCKTEMMAMRITPKVKRDAAKFRVHLRTDFEALMDRPAEEIVRAIKTNFEKTMQGRHDYIDALGWRDHERYEREYQGHFVRL